MMGSKEIPTLDNVEHTEEQSQQRGNVYYEKFGQLVYQLIT